ncbi:site-2 protease family protein [bacterium]|nr:site-2 protease family protein [bacterium]
MSCDFCGTELPSRVLLCPCGRLAYGKRIATLAKQADELEVQGAKPEARAAWLSALELLPESSGQAREVRSRIERLAPATSGVPARDGQTAASGSASGRKGIFGILTGIGLLLAKFKSIALFAAKGSKLLFSALTMLLSVWVYSRIFGLRFAAGFILLIWIHEMGHVIANRLYGNAISAPLFVPFLGAFIRLKVEPRDAAEDAVCGLAGPFLGSVGAFAALGLARVIGGDTGELVFAVGSLAIWLNLFNLIPVYPLDGGRAASVLDPALWLVLTIGLAVGGFWIGEPYLGLLAIFPMSRVMQGEKARREGAPLWLARYHTVARPKRFACALAYVGLASVLIATEMRTRAESAALLKKHARPDEIAAISSDSDESR